MIERQLRERPPRELSLATRITILFSGVFAQIGWGLFGLGLIFALVFVGNSDARYLLSFDGEWKKTQGLLTKIETTNSRVNKRNVYAFYFRYQVGEKEYNTYSYSQDTHLQENTPVEIEYKEGNPQRARIVGMRTSIFPVWVAFVLIFPFIGFMFWVIGLSRNRHTIRLLQNGLFTRGERIDKEPTSTKINNRTVYKYTFNFEANGKTYLATCSTHLTHLVEDEAQEIILYLPDNPDVNIVYDGVDGAPTINSQGKLEDNVKIGYWILPILSSVALLISLLFLIL